MARASRGSTRASSRRRPSSIGTPRSLRPVKRPSSTHCRRSGGHRRSPCAALSQMPTEALSSQSSSRSSSSTSAAKRRSSSGPAQRLSADTPRRPSTRATARSRSRRYPRRSSAAPPARRSRPPREYLLVPTQVSPSRAFPRRPRDRPGRALRSTRTASTTRGCPRPRAEALSSEPASA